MSKIQGRKRESLRRIVDVCMLILLLCLMSYQVTPDGMHSCISSNTRP